MVNLPADIKKFGFVEREMKNGKFLKNRCGRDFLYYALHYLYPTDYNPKRNSPEQIEAEGLFGISVPAMFAWTQIQFIYLPKYLKSKSLSLEINNNLIHGFGDFVNAILFYKIGYSEAISKVEENIRNGHVVGIDIAMAYNGLLDHVLFVYGFDEDFLYVCDTRKVPLIEYKKVVETDDVYYMKISKAEVKKRWKRFSRIWEIKKVY